MKTVENAGPIELTKLVESISRASREIRHQHHRVRRELGLTRTELMVLEVIENSPGINASIAAQNTGLQRSNFSVMLGELTSRGLVERHRDLSDRRVVRLFATASASRAFGEIYGDWSRRNCEAMLSRDDLSQLVSMLDEFAGTLAAKRHSRSR